MDLDVDGLRVFIAVPVNRDFPWQTTKSLVETASALSARGIPFKFQFLTQGSQIDRDRSELAKEFLESDCNRIFWIDSDMAWDADSFLRVLALTTKMPIVAASYPAKKEPGTEFLIEVSSLSVDANEFGCIEVLGCGLGFCCIDRHVMEELSLKAPKFLDKDRYVAMVFKTGLDDEGAYRSEDMHFFRECRKQGYKIMLDPMIELGHVGCKEHRGKLIDALSPAKKEEPCLVA